MWGWAKWTSEWMDGRTDGWIENELCVHFVWYKFQNRFCLSSAKCFWSFLFGRIIKYHQSGKMTEMERGSEILDTIFCRRETYTFFRPLAVDFVLWWNITEIFTPTISLSDDNKRRLENTIESRNYSSCHRGRILTIGKFTWNCIHFNVVVP